MPPPQTPDLLTVRDAARRLGVHENTVRNWVANGILESVRAPGARFHRFEPAEVERVRISRGTRPRTAQSERLIQGAPELVDATRLGVWADTMDARHIFPRLLRRLLATSSEVGDLSGRAGEGVAISGWDLRATLPRATPWLPGGKLAFELGVGAAPRAKAQSELSKRTANPMGVVPGETVFVFATPRRWPAGKAWAAERESAGPWRAVRVIDGDDLEAWLEATPAVHIWISEQVGLKPRGVVTTERWWARFRNRTRPALPPALFLAGRDSQRAELVSALGRAGAATGVRAEWRQDALAFICVALESDDDEAAPASPGLIIHDDDVWQRVASEPGLMTLIPLFPDPDLALAAENDKRVLIPYGAEGVPSGPTITLHPPHRHVAAEALRKLDVDFEQADRLAALARRSMPALVRRMSTNPTFRKPAWGHAPDSEVFAPLVLVGAWTDSVEDRGAVSEIVGRPWSDIERALRAAARTDDPPFVLSGGTWRVASREEALDVLVPSLTSGDLQRWSDAVPRVLLEDDPLAELALSERWAAQVDSTTQRCSSEFREGLADGLALLGSHGAEALPGDLTSERLARTVVQAVLDRAKEDHTGLRWRLLSAELPLLAEAAPELFLDSIVESASGPEPLLRSMFGDAKQSSSWMTSSPHTGLLWALETLCWPSEHLLGSTRALAQLAAIDPGGRLANRPLASLSAVLVPWIRHTSAPLERRLEAIDQTVRELPDVAWKLLEALWPETHATTSPPHPPRYRDWQPDSRGVPITEWLAVIAHVVRGAVELADHDAERWSQLVGRLGPLPRENRDHMIDTLEALTDALAEQPHGRLTLWEAITEVVGHHRAYAGAEWAMDETVLARLDAIAQRIEPRANVQRYARLFDWRPEIDAKPRSAHAEYEAALTELRVQAVRETLASASVDGLAQLAERAPVPEHLGWAVGLAAGDELRDDLLGWLTDEAKKGVVAAQWARQRAHSQGVAWVTEVFHVVADDEARLVLALQAPPTPALWRLIGETSGELTEQYWKNANPWWIEAESVAEATAMFLAHGRAFAAITALATHAQRGGPHTQMLDVGLVISTLEAALTDETQPDVRGDMLGFEIGLLLDYLQENGVELEVLARLEFGFFHALEHQRQPRALYAALGEAPELFVDLVSRVYRARNAPRDTPDQRAAAVASHAWHVLHDWRTVPGAGPDGMIDAEHLQSWVDKARLLLSDSDRADVGDEQIGELLSGSPPGADGAWPAEAVRDLVERIGSRELENGLHIGTVNLDGVTSRAVYEGGVQERERAARFRDWAAKTGGRWPRTSRLLRELAESYERDAIRQDTRARQDADRG